MEQRELQVVVYKCCYSAMDSEDEIETACFLACYILRDHEMSMLEIETRKARKTYNREAAMSRLNSYEKNDFRRRFVC